MVAVVVVVVFIGCTCLQRTFEFANMSTDVTASGLVLIAKNSLDHFEYALEEAAKKVKSDCRLYVKIVPALTFDEVSV